MSWVFTGVAAASSVAGGVIGAKGAMNAGNAAYTTGQLQYHQELMKSHYQAKVLQRKMTEAMHMQMAQAGGAGVVVGEGSPLVLAMKTMNDLQEDKTQIYREGQKSAWLMWQVGADKFSAAQSQATGSLLSGIGGAASAIGSGMSVSAGGGSGAGNNPTGGVTGIR
jgi:hypothetical protein